MSILTITFLLIMPQIWAFHGGKSATYRLAMLTISLGLCCAVLLLQFHGVLPFAVFTSTAEDASGYMATQYRALLTPLAVAIVLTFVISMSDPAYVPWPRFVRWLTSLLAIATLFPTLKPLIWPLLPVYDPTVPTLWAALIAWTILIWSASFVVLFLIIACFGVAGVHRRVKSEMTLP